ncbi:MAG: hypothetical protein HC910_17125 [Spirulinaceae cyanobacterium SM2_1_0]|nr:hypothetical protein [Spirulinaceae cyanobacterium SM2_1_0]
MAGQVKPEGKRGLILLVSNPNSASYAVEYHFVQKGTLETVWLLPSSDDESGRFGRSTRGTAEEIRAACEALAQAQHRPLQVYILRGVSPGDAQDTFDAVQQIFRRSAYEPGEIVMDFTGGTKPMSVGAIMACLPAERQLQYVPLNRVTGQSDGPFLVDYQYSAFDLLA